MQWLQRILLATDFSTASRDVLHEALQAARAFESDIILVHAQRYLLYTAATYQAIHTRLHHELDRMRAEILRRGGRVPHQTCHTGPAQRHPTRSITQGQFSTRHFFRLERPTRDSGPAPAVARHSRVVAGANCAAMGQSGR
jgi:hypothetical protein